VSKSEDEIQAIVNKAVKNLGKDHPGADLVVLMVPAIAILFLDRLDELNDNLTKLRHKIRGTIR
jgi:hypothetical protein